MGTQARRKDTQPGTRLAGQPYRHICSRRHTRDRGFRTHRLRHQGAAQGPAVHACQLQRPLNIEICVERGTHSWQTAHLERDVHVAYGALPHIAVADETRHGPHVRGWRQPHVLPRHDLHARQRGMAGMEILCCHRHEPYEQHLARRSLHAEVHGAMPKLPADGQARQRPAGLRAFPGRMAQDNGYVQEHAADVSYR